MIAEKIIINGRIVDIPSNGRNYSNLSLIDNGYFVGGGSQQDDGHLPINQRRQTEYTKNGYAIDRWNFMAVGGSNPTGKLTIKDDCIEITALNDTSIVQIKQQFERYSALKGEQVTLSVLSNDEVYSRTFYLGRVGSSLEIIPDKLYFFSVDSDNIHLRTSSGGSIRLQAVKLELGDQQTFAHQDADGKWILNDPLPDPTLELLKCWKYLQPITLMGYRSSVINVTAKNLQFTENLPVKMRANPTLLNPECLYWYATLADTWKTPKSVETRYVSMNNSLIGSIARILVHLPDNASYDLESIRLCSCINTVNLGTYGPLWLSAEP